MFAISDDDFSRLVIAQQFALSPRLDPSGSSWLPLPFWLYGTAFALFGRELTVAHTVAMVLGVLGITGIYVSARWVGLDKTTALLATLIGSLIPHAATYRAATVPDFPTAVLALLAATSLASSDPRRRALGGLAAMAATLSRYETWPLALVVAAFAMLDLRKSRRSMGLLATSILAPLGIALWLLHGQVNHHNALFFVQRVTAYKRALGGPAQSVIARLGSQPLAFLREEPELMIACALFGIATLLWAGRGALNPGGWRRPTLGLGSVLLFLSIGAWKDGVPTHHGERVLLSLWLGMSLALAALAATLYRRLAARFGPVSSGVSLAFCLGLLVVTTARFLRPQVVTVEPFAARERELAVGERLRSLLPTTESVALYTEDYGYFAIMAALGRPEASKPLVLRDPRQPQLDPLLEPRRLRERLEALGSRYLVVPAARRQQAKPVAQWLDSVGGFEIFRRN